MYNSQGDFKEDIFQDFMDRIKIVIHTSKGDITRDLRREPFSDGIKYYGKGSAPWWSARISCSDYETSDYTGCKHEIDFAFYFDPTGSDLVWAANTPVMAVEFAFQGAYVKDLYLDGKKLYTYTGHGQAKIAGAFWYNLKTGEIFGLP